MEREDTRPQGGGIPILGGHYYLLRLLQQRPRLNLYMGRRAGRQGRQTALVAVRELLLHGLTMPQREQVEYATFQEFVSPLLPGSTRMSTAADLQRLEGEHHYTIIHLDHASADATETSVLPLSDLLLHQADWPDWLDERLALRWCAQLARLVARLHHAGVVLGDLSPTTVLVNDQAAAWAPLLLPSWPPPSCYWPLPASQPQASLPAATIYTAAELAASIFSPARPSSGSPFAAPEAQDGKSDPCSDIYSLGAILYLLLAHHAPPAAQHRAEYIASLEQLELPPLHLFEQRHPEMLAPIIRRTLAQQPHQRYHAVFELVEALEAIEPAL